MHFKKDNATGFRQCCISTVLHKNRLSETESDIFVFSDESILPEDLPSGYAITAAAVKVYGYSPMIFFIIFRKGKELL